MSTYNWPPLLRKKCPSLSQFSCFRQLILNTNNLKQTLFFLSSIIHTDKKCSFLSSRRKQVVLGVYIESFRSLHSAHKDVCHEQRASKKASLHVTKGTRYYNNQSSSPYSTPNSERTTSLHILILSTTASLYLALLFKLFSSQPSRMSKGIIRSMFHNRHWKDHLWS